MICSFALTRAWAPFGGATVDQIEGRLLQWVTIIGGFTLGLGVISVLRINFRYIKQNHPDKIYKIAAVIAIVISGLPGVFPSPASEIGQKFYAHLPLWCAQLLGTQPGTIYDWFFNTMNAPMMATMFGTLAFYIASAAYRAFRARTPEATLLLIAALLVMFWRVPMGEELLRGISHDLPDLINTFLMRTINGSVQRAIIIGAALGAAAMSLRILLGIDRTYMGRS